MSQSFLVEEAAALRLSKFCDMTRLHGDFSVVVLAGGSDCIGMVADPSRDAGLCPAII